jgi:DNA invertase Pin-like site-specific DNA recombinase
MGSIKRRKAFSYARISTGTQTRGSGIQRQLQDSREYAERHGFELVEQLEEVGSAFKGKNLAPTAVLGRFLDAVRAGRVPPGSRLLIESLDRLSRTEALKAIGTFIAVLTAGIEITTLVDGKTYTAETTFEELHFSMGIMHRAHDESKTKSMRLKATWQLKKEQASTKPMTAWCPSWLKLSQDRSRYEVIEDRAHLIRHIFSEAASGVGSYSIVRRLNERREPHFGRSGVWNISFVSKVLKNPAVLGHFQPCKEVNGRRMPDGPVIENYFPEIVDAHTFRRVQIGLRERLARGRGRKGHNVANVFPRDMMVCAYCGSSMRFESKSRGEGSFICYAALRGIDCVRVRWAYRDFETAFLHWVREVDLSSIMRSDESGRTAALEKTYRLLDTGAATDFIAGKLREVESEKVALEMQLREKERERTTSAIDPISDVRELVARLQAHAGDDDEETYRLRSAVASRLRSIVEIIEVAPAGKAPLHRVAIDALKKQGREVTYERLPDYDLPYFAVRLVDGTLRTVWPDPKDPTRFTQQLFSTDAGEALRITPEGVIPPRHPDAD